MLDGAIEINGRSYEKHTYGFLPAGYPRERARSTHGAVLLTMFYGPVSVRSGRGTGFDERRLVEYVNPLTMDWDPGLVDPQLSKGVAIKPLRTDPDTGETSFLYCSPPHRVATYNVRSISSRAWRASIFRRRSSLARGGN